MTSPKLSFSPCWYCLSAALMEASSVRRGNTFKCVFFLMKSIAAKSSVSSIATSSSSPFCEKAMMLLRRATGSGMRESVSNLICVPTSETNGMPRMYAYVRRNSSSPISFFAVKISPTGFPVSFASASAVSKSLPETNPASERKERRWVSEMYIAQLYRMFDSPSGLCYH